MSERKNTVIPWISDIPAHWNECRIKDIGFARNGLTYKPEELVDENKGIIVLRLSNIQDSKLCFENNVYVETVPAELKIKKDDITVCKNQFVINKMKAWMGSYGVSRFDGIDAIVEKINNPIERLKELKRSLINEVVTGRRAINTLQLC